MTDKTEHLPYKPRKVVSQKARRRVKKIMQTSQSRGLSERKAAIASDQYDLHYAGVQSDGGGRFVGVVTVGSRKGGTFKTLRTQAFDTREEAGKARRALSLFLRSQG